MINDEATNGEWKEKNPYRTQEKDFM